jgi:hypothetical protein
MAEPVTSTIEIPSADLGGTGAPDAACCSSQAIALLGQAAGADMRLASLSIDVTSHAIGEGPVAVAVKIDKRARSIVFASCEARAGEVLVFSAQALFSR